MKTPALKIPAIGFTLALISTLIFVGCGGEKKGTSTNNPHVEGKPALKAPEGEKNKQQKTASDGMQMHPSDYLFSQLDKNRDGVISNEELPDDGLSHLDLNGDGKIPRAEAKKYYDDKREAEFGKKPDSNKKESGKKSDEKKEGDQDGDKKKDGADSTETKKSEKSDQETKKPGLNAPEINSDK